MPFIPKELLPSRTYIYNMVENKRNVIMEKLLEVKSLNKNYNDFSLKDISFSLEKGKVTGLIGKAGSGKTTLFLSILKLINIDSGEVIFDGKEITNSKKITEISYLECDRTLYPEIIGYDYKELIKSAYKYQWSESIYCRYLETFFVNDNYKLSEYSPLTKIKFFLAVELAKSPKLLILDEPTEGVYTSERAELLNIIRKIANDEDITILFSSKSKDEITLVADNVLYLEDGELLLDMSIKAMEQMNDFKYFTGGKKIV